MELASTKNYKQQILIQLKYVYMYGDWLDNMTH